MEVDFRWLASSIQPFGLFPIPSEFWELNLARSLAASDKYDRRYDGIIIGG